MDMIEKRAIETTKEFRVVRVPSIYGDHFLGVHEVYFHEGKINSIIEAVPYLAGTDLLDIKSRYEEMAAAFFKPVIDEEMRRELDGNELQALIAEDREKIRQRREADQKRVDEQMAAWKERQTLTGKDDLLPEKEPGNLGEDEPSQNNS